MVEIQLRKWVTLTNPAAPVPQPAAEEKETMPICTQELVASLYARAPPLSPLQVLWVVAVCVQRVEGFTNVPK